ncbi:MAG: sporulation protein YabP [Clostridiales bacterium GWE2_32_10]|nr:MAG: sporulation protein YabP [Clostridiales bacterium GWE2_32_10]HBY20269.1 sporulation protein YabP [Clostridiales bacterium]
MVVNEKREAAVKHNISMDNRQRFSASGIVEVISFEESVIIIDTKQGVLVIKGKNLHIDKLNLETSEIELNGQIDSLTYNSNPKRKTKGFIKSLFK